MAATPEPQVGPLVLVPVAQDAVRDTGVDEQPSGIRLENAGPVRRLDLGPGAQVDDDGGDAGPVEEVGGQEPGGSAADDRYLRGQYGVAHKWLLQPASGKASVSMSAAAAGP